ncbi:hypothetical protein NCS52_01432700 [Fusarium sp. LHS14.1]|nr:hypothetical protein NCS52_01432700 [Fusarium sp. LHS14.1]
MYLNRMQVALGSGLVQLHVRSSILQLDLGASMMPLTPPDEEHQGMSKRRKIVRFEEPTVKQTVGYQAKEFARKTGSQLTHQTSRDLRSSGDVCFKLTGKPPAQSASSSVSALHCFGHLDCTRQKDNFRHSFYPSCPGPNRRDTECSPMALDEIIMTSRRDLINPIDQLRLARMLVLAALKFYSTPWLNDVWQLRDLSMSVDDIEDLSQSIHNMHLSTELGQTQVVQMEDMQTVTIPNSQAAEEDSRHDEEVRCNIKCRPLWSLGVALMQIDHWTKIDLGDVLAVRRAAARTSQISPKYRELTQRCLECDFGRHRGQDLSGSPLHQAVYKVVLGELDRLLSLKEQEMSPLHVSDDGDELGYCNAFNACTV